MTTADLIFHNDKFYVPAAAGDRVGSDYVFDDGTNIDPPSSSGLIGGVVHTGLGGTYGRWYKPLDPEYVPTLAACKTGRRFKRFVIADDADCPTDDYLHRLSGRLWSTEADISPVGKWKGHGVVYKPMVAAAEVGNGTFVVTSVTETKVTFDGAQPDLIWHDGAFWDRVKPNQAVAFGEVVLLNSSRNGISTMMYGEIQAVDRQNWKERGKLFLRHPGKVFLVAAGIGAKFVFFREASKRPKGEDDNLFVLSRLNEFVQVGPDGFMRREYVRRFCPLRAAPNAARPTTIQPTAVSALRKHTEASEDLGRSVVKPSEVRTPCVSYVDDFWGSEFEVWGPVPSWRKP
jgi:hypothetical protein